MPPWVKGQASANPGGRPKALQGILSIGRINSVPIMKRMCEIALQSEDLTAAIAAAKLVLERTYGKAAQQVEVVGGLEHRHFVARLPEVAASAAEWEGRFGPPALADYSEKRTTGHDSPSDPVTIEGAIADRVTREGGESE